MRRIATDRMSDTPRPTGSAVLDARRTSARAAIFVSNVISISTSDTSASVFIAKLVESVSAESSCDTTVAAMVVMVE